MQRRVTAKGEAARLFLREERIMGKVGAWSRENWFVLLVPLLASVAWLLARSVSWRGEGGSLEAALLVDACLTIPLLYALCYGRRLPLRQLLLRMAGLACLGIYLLTYVVPPDAQRLLPAMAPVRWAGLTVLIGLELLVVAKALQLVFGGSATAEELQAKTGAPPLIAKLMVLEARFWKAVWKLLRRR